MAEKSHPAQLTVINHAQQGRGVGVHYVDLTITDIIPRLCRVGIGERMEGCENLAMYAYGVFEHKL